MAYIPYSIKVFTNHLNHRYFTTKTKLNGKKAKWIKELATFDFTIIYYKGAKNPINNLFRQFNFKDNNELSTTKRQPLPNFLFKFQEHLKNTKNDLAEKQSIDFDETPLLRSVLSLAKAPQDTNSTKVLPTRNKDAKNDPTEEQSIDSSETPLLGNVLSLAGTP